MQLLWCIECVKLLRMLLNLQKDTLVSIFLTFKSSKPQLLYICSYLLLRINFTCPIIEGRFNLLA